MILADKIMNLRKKAGWSTGGTGRTAECNKTIRF